MNSSDEQWVYVVDDDPGMIDSTLWLLESVGLRGLPYTSGQAFLEDCQDDAPACILLDVRMPGLGGLGVQEALADRGIRLPVIFVSGHADVPIVLRAFRAGAFDFLEKPYNEQLLLDSVQKALQQRRAQHQRIRAEQALDAKLATLTARERDVFLPLAQGYGNREVAEQLGISVKTVDLYRSRVMKRLQATSLPDLVGMAVAAGLLDPLNLRPLPPNG
ncbi:response regulator transcription factor [Isoalcanivorax beigongshangi]|uniref:Response regulator transcription factor n=1 Tax=Isoalcanivorax beigongshangi TaxID=3238810 RepID=A0ABV4AKK9_9GAMM